MLRLETWKRVADVGLQEGLQSKNQYLKNKYLHFWVVAKCPMMATFQVVPMYLGSTSCMNLILFYFMNIMNERFYFSVGQLLKWKYTLELIYLYLKKIIRFDV